jgi:hypothetical protein
VAPDHVVRVADMVYAHRVRSLPFGKTGPSVTDVIQRLVGRN